MLPFKRYLSLIISTNTRNYSKRTSDPGIRTRKALLTEKGNNQQEIVEDYDELESDFMNVNVTHRLHEDEKKAQHEQIKYHIVQGKYFKDKFPNFLTWHDKEQIRYLHSVDPEEWSIDKLSEGFPALPEVITKIVKAKWTKSNQNKITNHDKSVQENWKQLKKGKLELPEDLKQHLNKFSNRALRLKPFEMPTDKTLITMKKTGPEGEFSQIITSYENIKKKNLVKDNCVDENHLVESRKFKDKQVNTLDKLHEKLQYQLQKGMEISKDDNILVDSLGHSMPNESSVVEVKPVNINNVIKSKCDTEMVSLNKTGKDYNHLIYPERIVIPAKLRKKSCVYKLNDCFYDVDGEFLYRVPGMG